MTNRTGGSDPTFTDLLNQALSRREMLRLGLGTAAVSFLGEGTFPAALLGATGGDAPATSSLIHFRGVPVSKADAVRVPEGYVSQVLYRWGDPVNGVTPPFKPDATNTAAEQERQGGMGHDGMEWFPHPLYPAEPSRGLLCINHEYADQGLLYPDGAAPAMSMERTRKSQAAHGVSVIEVERDHETWRVVDSKYSRRITATTEMRLGGPAAEVLGENVFGTFNNCAGGRTPWGTYLTCEENFQDKFGTGDADWVPNEREKRYELTKTGYKARIGNETRPVYRWWEQDARFDLAVTPDEANRFGYVVEIDPTDPHSKPVKRTALGRFFHENAALTLAKDGRVVVYMGDDDKNEYIYKFVSRGRYDPRDRGANLNLLDDGTLYVARFRDDRSGEWLELQPTGELKDLAQVCIFTRLAADQVRPTRMDRPEWVAVHPQSGEVYVSLTNNDTRGSESGPAVDAANPRASNLCGHIVRWREDKGDAASRSFQWDVFLIAGDPERNTQTPPVNIQGDPFGSPDGLWFDPRGILWIQTDVSNRRLWSSQFENLGNNMMLAADPRSGTVRRFLTGPRGCEVTGMAMTPDFKTLFVNIQHPGEPGDDITDPVHPCRVSTWPDGDPTGRPRSATVAVYRPDGGVIGS